MPSNIITLQSILDEMRNNNVETKNNHIELSSKIDSIKTDLTGLITAVKDELNGKITNMRSELSNRIVEVDYKTCVVADSLERLKKIGDLVIVGVPYDSNENIANILTALCNRIKFDISYKPHQIFRTGIKTSSSTLNNIKNTPAIILKFGDKLNANAMLNHFYACKPLPNAADLGFSIDANIYLNNSLTTLDRQIYSNCIQLKFHKLISRVMVIDGVVNIQMASNTPKVPIPSMQIFGEFQRSMESLNIQRNHENSNENVLKRKPSSPPSLSNPTKAAATSGGSSH